MKETNLLLLKQMCFERFSGSSLMYYDFALFKRTGQWLQVDGIWNHCGSFYLKVLFLNFLKGIMSFKYTYSQDGYAGPLFARSESISLFMSIPTLLIIQ
jgi:hypothetical protein